MTNLFRVSIVVCLLAGVIFLGINIFTGSSQSESDTTGKKSQVAEKVLKLKANAIKLKQKFQKVQKKVNHSPDKASLDVKRDPSNKDAGDKPENPSTKVGTPKPPVVLDPLDEEDRQLTAEVMGDQAETRKEVEQFEDDHAVDPNRLKKIRDLYAKTIEILDFN